MNQSVERSTEGFESAEELLASTPNVEVMIVREPTEPDFERRAETFEMVGGAEHRFTESPPGAASFEPGPDFFATDIALNPVTPGELLFEAPLQVEVSSTSKPIAVSIAAEFELSITGGLT